VSTSHTVFLRKNATGELAEATLHERIDGAYARRVDDAWLTFLAAEEAKAKSQGQNFIDLEHSHWAWEAKVAESARLLSCPTLAIECGGETQGLMLLKTLPQAESFYECHGLLSLGIDREKENLKYYELSAEEATKFFSRRKP